MDKRRSPRRKASLDAVFNMGDGEGYPCRIEDFTEQGMYLSRFTAEDSTDIKDKLDSLEVIASCTFKSEESYYSVNVVVVHYQDSGMGVKFIEPDSTYLNALKSESARTFKADNLQRLSEKGKKEGLAAAKKANLINHTNSRVKLFFSDRFPEFFKALDTSLVEEMEKQASDSAQHQYVDAIAQFKKQAKQIAENYVGNITAAAADVAQGRFQEADKQETTDKQESTLALVEKEAFEDWLIVRVTTSKVELQYREVLIELQIRLDSAFVSEQQKRVYNPYSPAAFCEALHASIVNLKLSNRVERLVFKVFQEQVLDNLAGLYKSLNKLFVDAEILPDIDVNKYLAAQAMVNSSGRTLPEKEKNTDHSKKDESEIKQSESEIHQNQPQPSLNADKSQPVNPAQVPDSPPLGETGAHHVERSRETLTQTISPVSGSHQLVEEGMQRAKKAYSIAERLLQVKHNVESDHPQLVRSNGGGETPMQVLDALSGAIEVVKQSLIQGDIDLDAPGALKQHLANMADKEAGLTSQHFESAEMIENLLNSIVENDRFEQELRSDLRKLEIPLLEVLVRDPSLFTADYHPLRQSVNYLALLSDKGSVNINANRPVIKECIDQILASDMSDMGGVNIALDKLEGLVQKEKKYIERNLSRVTEACEGQQKIKVANNLIESELKKRFSDQAIPQVILDLVENGWRELMRLCYFREGIGSRAWEMTLMVLDQLIVRLIPEAYDESKLLFRSEELCKLVEKGLAKVPNTSGRHQQIISNLKGPLQSDVLEALPAGEYSAAKIDKESPDERYERLGIDGDDKSFQRWVKRVKNLKEGQWLEFDANDDSSRLSQLAWISDEFNRFVFVNHHGMKVADLTLEELAFRLRRGDVVVLSDSSLPAVERGLDALVQKIYDQLAEESALDQLTGLKTRKEFERCLAQGVARAKKRDLTYVLIFIDILQFKVINNTCGYEVGDGFLREIAQRIKSTVPEGTQLGRIGGNEFGVLLEVESEQKGYILATELKSVIEERRFTYSEQSFVITAVVSMIGFDISNNHVMELLRSVESAAEICKKSGQKEIQLVRPGDERMEERDEVMSWVARINRALDEDHLKVRCQMIAPIIDPDSVLPHFEVLLTVVDESGEHLPPADFIKAAEEYSRMGAVDRWVINSVLQWLVQNPNLLDHVGGFSINLSGHSLNDETFLDFVFESLVRYGIPRNKLIFEITETTAVANLEDAADFINEMRNIGCRFSLDDFGAGQSSYAYLKQLPVDFIKIDGAFVRNITDDDVDYALVKSITEMGHFLNKKIIAEYVSSEEILEVVRDIGVDYVQGFYLGKPVMIEDLHNALQPAHQVA